MNLKTLTSAAFGLVALPMSAHAAVITLNFEGINTDYNNSTSFRNINNFYNGGTSSGGTSGTNFGVSFSANSLAICLNSTTVTCSNTSRGGLAPTSSQAGLFFLDGTQSLMNVAAGFTTGFSFNYVSLSSQGSVSVFSGLNGTGTNLGTISLAANAGSCPGYNAGFCPFKPVGVTFAGTALSVSFAGVANQIVFDDITFGSAIVGGGAVPEPATWAMMIGGSLRYRRRRTSVSFA